MFNIYRIEPKPGKDQRVRVRIAEAASRLASLLVRKSDPGVVMLADGRVEVMRWGFHRSFNPAINNARSDKLDSGMWAEALRHERRCVIPVSAFYEWGWLPADGGSFGSLCPSSEMVGLEQAVNLAADASEDWSSGQDD